MPPAYEGNQDARLALQSWRAPELPKSFNSAAIRAIVREKLLACEAGRRGARPPDRTTLIIHI
jgi:hypothetical protein